MSDYARSDYANVYETLQECRVICDASADKREARERITERYNEALMKIIEDCSFFREMKARRQHG